LFAVYYDLLIEIFRWRREEERIIFLSAESLTRMRREAMEELLIQGSEEGKKLAFFSEADIIFA
jgi:hypothetical protein